MGEMALTPPKERIIALAREKFVREGFSGVSVDELVENLGMSKKTFYKAFKSKDDLLSQLVERILLEMESGVLAILKGEGTFVEKLDGFMMFMGKNVGRIFTPFLRDVQRHAPHLWQRVHEFRRERMTRHFMGFIQEGIGSGFIRQDVNPRILLLAFLATIENILVPSVLVNESFSADEALRNILRMLFHGILTVEAGEQLRALLENRVPQSL